MSFPEGPTYARICLTLVVATSGFGACKLLPAPSGTFPCGSQSECLESEECLEGICVESSDCKRAGGCPPSDDGGEPFPDAGRSDAGEGQDAGSDAGDGGGNKGDDLDAGPPPPCPGSTRPRLRCDKVEVFPGAGSYANPTLAAVDPGFFAGIVRSGDVLTRRVSPLGQRGAESTLASGVNGWVASAGRGPHWAMAWNPDGGKGVSCRSSADDGGVTQATALEKLSMFSLALSDEGALGFGGIYYTGGYLHAAVTDGGCPATLNSITEIGVTEMMGVAAGHVPGQGAEGFRFAFSAWYGQASTLTLAKGAGPWVNTNRLRRAFVGTGVRQLFGAISESGDSMVTASSWKHPDGGSELSGMAFRTDLSTSGGFAELGPDPQWWSVSTCGPGCTGTAAIEGPGNFGALSLYFVSDSANLALAPLGAGAYDVECSVPTKGQAAVALAYAGGKLGVFYTDGASNSLYLCEKPIF